MYVKCVFYYYLISLFAHIGYNPIEKHIILTIHVRILERNKYIITAKQVEKVL